MKMGKIDYREFKKVVQRFKEADKVKIDELTLKLILDIGNISLAAVKKQMTIDKVVDSGHLRRNWFIGNVEKNGDMMSIELYNNVEYASFVEKGHRGVAIDIDEVGWRVMHTETHWTEGRFMLKISQEKVKKRIEDLISKRQREFLEELLKNG